MTRGTETLPELRDRAVLGIEDLIGVLGLGARLGGEPADPREIRVPFQKVGSFDADALTADSHRLQTAHRAVAEHLYRMPEQQARLGENWNGISGERALAAVIDHQSRAESDLYVLRNLADATTAASVGVEQLLRTWYLTVSRLSTPLVGGIPLQAVPAAVAEGTLPLGVVLGDIESRSALYRKTAAATVEGIDEILDNLNRATDGMDIEPYPKDVPSPVPDTQPSPERTADHRSELSTTASGTVLTGASEALTAPDRAPTDVGPMPFGGSDDGHHDVPLRLAPDRTPVEAHTEPVSHGLPRDGDVPRPGTPGRQDSSHPPAGRGPDGDLALAGDQ